MSENNYFDLNEIKGEELMNSLNNSTKWLNNLQRPTIDRLYYDMSGETFDGRTVIVELKYRNAVLIDGGMSGCTKNGPYTADTVFIEDYKLCDMLLDSEVEGVVPLYVNFLGDDTAVIFNLSKLTKRPKRFTNIKIESKGYGAMQRTNREGLYFDDAIIYQKINGKWEEIRKGSCHSSVETMTA